MLYQVSIFAAICREHTKRHSFYYSSKIYAEDICFQNVTFFIASRYSFFDVGVCCAHRHNRCLLYMYAKETQLFNHFLMGSDWNSSLLWICYRCCYGSIAIDFGRYLYGYY